MVRYANHKKTFNNIKYQTDTELSIENWEPTNYTTEVLNDVSYVSMKS